MSELKLVPIGDSIGIILPRELVEKLGLHVGDEVAVTETPTGAQLSIAHADVEAQLAVARRIMRERHDALRELAK